MAPDRAGALVVLDMRSADGVRSSVERLDPINERSPFLVLSWYSKRPPVEIVEGRTTTLWSFGKGAVFVQPTEGYRQTVPTAVDVQTLGDGRFIWEDIVEGDQLMFVLVAPPGHAIAELNPPTARAKNFKGRVALFWPLARTDSGRVRARWRLQATAEAAGIVAAKINSEAARLATVAMIPGAGLGNTNTPAMGGFGDVIAKTLAGLGLSTKYIPGIGPAVVLAFVGLELAAATPLMRPSISGVDPLAVQTALVALSVMLALVADVVGGIWDSLVFDRLYGPSRPWSRQQRPLGLFPSGMHLHDLREQTRIALGVGKDDSVYTKASQIHLPSRDQDEIESKLALSKGARTLILPALLVAVGALISAIRSSADPDRSSWLLIAIVAFLFGLSLFVPYLKLRVEHIAKLYRSALDVYREP